MLTDKELKKASPRSKPYKLYDEKGLVMRVKPNGTKGWEFKYRVDGPNGRKIEKLLSFGVYDEVSLKEARTKCMEARKVLHDGKDPSEVRKAARRLSRFNAENSFLSVAEEWHKNQSDKWTPKHGQKLWRRLELHVMSTLGARPIGEITTLELLDVLRKAEASQKIHTAHCALRTCRAIFQYAVLSQRIRYNPALDLQGVLKSYRESNLPTIGHNQLPGFLAKLDETKMTPMNRLAVKFLILTFVRQGELRQAKWSDIDLASGEWRVRAETMKMRELHHVSLSQQAMQILRQLALLSGGSEFLFPSQHKQKHPIMSENTINKVIHDMGYKGELVGHGFRSLASTILNEKGFRADVIERQLAHMPRDKVRAAYNRAQYLSERREMMQWWGNYVEGAGMIFDHVADG